MGGAATPPLRVERVHIIIGVALVLPLVLAADTCAGALSCNLMYVEPLLSKARARAAADVFTAALRSMAGW